MSKEIYRPGKRILSDEDDLQVALDYKAAGSLRKVAKKWGISHETVAKACYRNGVKIDSPEKARKRRLTYPREWSCQQCGKTRKARSHAEYRRKTCSKRCRTKLWRSQVT